jgi:hypothetical protein
MPINPELASIHDFVAAEVVAVGIADSIEGEAAPTTLAATQAADECVRMQGKLGS